MTIKSVGLKNFTVFKDFQLEVSSGINIFVGENGTGKTHLLKALYAACEFSKNENLENPLTTWNLQSRVPPLRDLHIVFCTSISSVKFITNMNMCICI